MGGGLGVGRGGEGVELLAGALLEVGLEALHQRKLRGVGAEGLELALLDAADVEGDGPGRGERRGAAGKEEAGGGVVEALDGVRGAEGGEAFGRGGPVDGGGGEEGDHAVVGVGVAGAVAAEGEDDLGAIGADAFDKQGGGLGEVGELKLAVLVVEHLVVGDAEDRAGCGELGAAHLAQLGGGGGGAAIGGGLAVGEAEDGGLDATLGGEHQCSAEAEALVVGMGGDAEEFEGGFVGHG